MIWLLLAMAEPSLDSEVDVCSDPQIVQPLTLCLAERSFERADKRLNKQWKSTFAFVKRSKGQAVAKQLRENQRTWLKKRDEECEEIAAPTPTTQQGRNFMSCMAYKTEERTLQLQAMIEKT